MSIQVIANYPAPHPLPDAVPGGSVPPTDTARHSVATISPRFLAAFVVAALLVCIGVRATLAQESTLAGGSGLLRIMTFNIHHGEGMDGRLDLERIAKVITDARADIVGLQEVDRGVARTDGRDLVAELAAITDMQFAFGRNIDLQGGEYGNALLSRFPIVSIRNQLLDPVGGGEQRGVLDTVVDVAGQHVRVLTTHFDHRPDSAQRPRSAEELRTLVTEQPAGPVVLLGDFNDVPGSGAHQVLTQVVVDAWAVVGQGDGGTVPADNPRRRIDWVLLRGLTPIDAAVIRTDASDHLPLVVAASLPSRQSAVARELP
jgi:endonuclease/exonuclease/phosphatase family metal-dependent hydrolase